jgi:hypothetical protein
VGRAGGVPSTQRLTSINSLCRAAGSASDGRYNFAFEKKKAVEPMGPTRNEPLISTYTLHDALFRRFQTRMVYHRHASPASSAELQGAYLEYEHVPDAADESHIQGANLSTTFAFKICNAHSFACQYYSEA